MLLAVLVDGRSFYILHDDVRTTIGQCPPIQQSRDVHMLKTGQDLPFDAKAPLNRRHQSGAHDLDCHPVAKLIVRAFTQIHCSHAAAAQLSYHLVCADGRRGRWIQRHGLPIVAIVDGSDFIAIGEIQITPGRDPARLP